MKLVISFLRTNEKLSVNKAEKHWFIFPFIGLYYLLLCNKFNLNLAVLNNKYLSFHALSMGQEFRGSLSWEEALMIGPSQKINWCCSYLQTWVETGGDGSTLAYSCGWLVDSCCQEEASVPGQVDFSIELLECLTAWQLASYRVSDQREIKAEARTYLMT